MTDRARHSYKGKKGGQARRGNAGANKQASSNAKQIYKKFKQTAESNRERGSYTSGNGNRTVSVRHKQGSQTNTTSGSSSNTRKPTSTADRMKQFSTGGSRRQMTSDARKVQRDSVRSQTSIIKGAVESGVGGTMKGFGSMVEQSKATGKSGSINHKLGGSSNTRRGDRTRPGQRQPKRQDNRNTVKQIQEERKKAGENMANKGDKLITKGTKRIEEEKKNMSGFGKWLTDLEVAGIQFGGDALVGAATGGIGTLPSMYIRAAGSGMHSAEQMGADRQSAFRYGLATGGLEVATEKMFGLAKPLEKIYGKGVGDLLMTKVLGKLAKNTGKTGAVKQSFMAAFGEGLEEMVAEGVDPAIANKIYADALAEDKRDEAYRSAIQNGATEAEAKEYADKVYNSIHQSTSVADILRAGSIGAAMGGLLGGGASVIEASNGARIKQQFGKDGLRDIANRAANVDDKVAAVRAQEVHNRLKEGMDISDIQANMVVQAVQEQEAKDQKTQRRYNEAIGVEMRRNGYESPIVTDDNGNPVAYAPATNDKVQAIRSEAKERLNTVRKKTDTKMTEEESNEVADAYAAVMTGVATSSQVGMFTTSHPEARALFETMNPKIKLPKSNEQTREFLFGLSARNYVETAKQETEYRQDVIRGYLEEDMTIDYGTRGQEEFSKLMEDENIDPRMSEKADAAGVFEDYYRAGAMGIPFEQILQNGNPVHNLLTYAQKKAAYESGFADMSVRNAIPKGSVISMGQRVAETKVGTHRGKLVDSEHLLTGKQRRMYQALAEKLNININIVSDEDVNGFYKDGEVYLSVNNDGRGLALVFGHEITHHIKAVSPENYEKLEKLVREKWEERGGIDEAIKEKQKQYKEKANQDLTEDEALEEIIADATYEMFGDVEFVKKICAEDRTFAQSILYAIRRVLADIRECLANGRGFTPSQNEALLSHLDILSEFEDLWLQGLRDAAREGERIQSETVAESITEEDVNNSDSVNDFIRLSLREEDMSQELVERLNGEKKVKVYRAMQYIDGKLYPPMAAVVEGNLNGGTELNKWEQSEERPDLCIWKKGGKVVEPGTEGAKPYFRLWKRNSNKNGGKGDPVDARYNPYIHTSLSPLNDQFSSAYARPNMVVVEGEVPESELTSKYKAELAKDSVGETEWKSGKVAGELKKVGKPRRVILSRYFRPTRVLENDEVAQEIAKLLEGTDIKIPANVVTPGLLSALENQGVAIDRENVPDAYKKNETTRFSVRDQNKRDAGEKLTEAQFYRLYSAHKLDLRKNGNIEEQVESIKKNGFRGDAGFGNNVVPSSINSIGRYTEAERREQLSEYLPPEQIDESIRRLRENPEPGFWSEDTYFPEANATERRYGGRKGDTVLLVPEGSLDVTKYTESVKNGFKPFDYEVVKVERDFQPYYELYSKAYDKAKTDVVPLSERFNSEDEDIRYSIREDVTQAEESVQNLGSNENNTFEVPDEPENIRYSLFGHKNKQVKPVVTKADGVTGELFTTYDGTPVQSTVIDMTEEIMKILGKSDTDIKKVRTFMDSVADYMEGVAARYTFIGLEDVNNADITIRRDKDGNPDSVVLSAMVKNGEYPVNFDFSSVCKKREAVTNLINDLSKLDNGEFINNVSLSQENLWKLNEILMQEGFETACLGCFVETKRYNIEAWADSFVEKWNAAVEKINPNAEYFDFGSKEDLWYTNDIIEEFKEEKKKRKKKNKGKELSNEQTIEALLDTDVNLLKKLRRVDLMSPEGIKGLQKINPSVYGVLYGHYGSGTPKPVQPFTPYNSEIAMMGRKKNYTKTNNDETVRKTNGELVEYLRGIGGLRTQSFSDFLIQNVFDYMQMISDMAARGFPGHAYSKEIAFAKLFGMTGLKINMSIMFDVDPDGIAPGLDKDGNYVVADKVRQSREKENGREVFAFSFGWDDAIALQNDPRYDGNVGTIGVGLSDMHIRKMLEDPDIKFIIPYHKSGLPKPIAERSGLNIADDYTSTQNTLTITSITDKDGKDVTNKFGKKYFKGLYKEKGSWRAVFDQFHKDTEGFTVNTVKAEEGSGKFDIYTGDKGLDATQDPKATVENYFEWCVDNGYLPLFYQFADHENYYKLLYDFNVYKNDGTFAPQKAVENIYPEDLFDIIDGYMKEANEEKQKQAPKWDVVKQRATAMLQGEERYSLPETDSEGRKLSDAQREYFKDTKVLDGYGNLLVMYHGSLKDFDTFDKSRIRAADYDAPFNGFWFSSDKETDPAFREAKFRKAYYLNIANPASYDIYKNVEKEVRKTYWTKELPARSRSFGDETRYRLQEMGYDGVHYDGAYKFTEKNVKEYNEKGITTFEDAKGKLYDLALSEYDDARLYPHGSKFEIMPYLSAEDFLEDNNPESPYRTKDVWVAFEPNQIKAIGNNNPTENEDTRYSLPEDNPPTEEEVIDQANLDDEFSEWAYDSSPYAQEGKAVRVKSEAELRKQVEQLRLDKRLTHGRLLDTKPIKKDIEDLLRTMATITQEAGNPVVGFEGKMSKQNQRIVDDTVKNAKRIYKMMKQGRDNDAVALAMTCADDIVSRIQIIDDANYDVYKKIKGYLKSTPMRISEEDSHDIPDFADFKKDNFGKVRIVKEGGIPVEEAYSELSEMFPGMFDEEITHPAEMLMEIVDARGRFEPYDVMLTAEEREQLLKDTTADLLDIIAEGQPYRTWADKKSEQYQNKVNMLRERYKESMRKLRTQKNEKIKKIQKKHKEQREEAKDKKKRLKSFGSIEANHKWLSDRLLKPTDDKHIPENYKLAVADLLMALDLQTERSKQLEKKTGHKAQKTFKFQQLLDAYEEIFQDKGAGLFEYDDEMVQMLKTSLIKHLDGKSVDALDTKTMGEIDILLKAIVGNVRNANKAFAAEKETTISEMAEKVRDDCKQVVKRSGTFNDRKRTIGRWLFETNKLLNISMKKPREFFEHLGGGMTDAYMEIRHGMDKHFDNMAVLREEFGKIFSDYNNKKKPGSAIEKWRDTSLMKSFDLESGETITLNPAQIMSLYCLNKREQAHKHMYEGAGIIASRVQGVSGKVVKLKNEVEGTQVAVTRADVDKIIATLSEEQIKIAEQLQGLLNGIVQEWGNETSMLMFNYEKFTEKDYFPIKSDDAYVASNFEEKGKQAERIRNFGFTKGTDVNASNPIVIADIFEVVADHCNKMSLYNSLAAPLSDFQRMYNTNFWFEDEQGSKRSSVQNELRVAFGTDVDKYISNLMADINNNTQVRPEETAALINKSLANYKKATIGLNLRVAVQQPTAIVRAFDIISPKYFVGMDKAHLIRNAKEMIEHCPIARWKSWGHNEVDMARDIDDIMMNRAWSRFDLITMGTYGALDIGTWGMIWSAVKKEVKATHPDVEAGSDEFWDLCNERASEVFDKTQVVDSVLHRSQVMRDQQIMVKLLTSFMAEPTTTFNMLQSDLVEARDLWAEGRKKEAMAKANRVIVVFTANAAAVSAAAAFIDWLRDKQPDDDDDDKEGWELWYANFLSNFVDNANVLMMIPFVKDILQLKDGWGTSNMAFEGWESLMKSINEWEKFINGKSKKSNEELIWMTAEGIGLVAGIPVKSVHKDLTALLNRFGISFAAEQGTEKVRIETEDGGILEVYPQKETITDKFFKMIGIKDDSNADEILNKFGLNLSDEEKKEKAMNDKIREISEKVEGLEGEERDKKLWETITRKKGDDEPGLTQYLEAGNTDAAEEMLKLFKGCGGSEEYFNEKMMKIAKSSYKKTIGEQKKLIEQTKLYDFMLGHGMSEADISLIARDSDTRKKFQKAYALGEEEKAILLLSDLIDAGLTYEDYEWSCKNAYRTVKPSDYATGEFSWPTNGTITSGFGRRSSPTAGASSFHQAIDIGAPTGTPVNAADGGKVIYCGWYGGYGNRVVVDHGNGYKTCYSHLSGYQVKQGQVLRKGQQLGKVGSTGVSTGPHLDFQVEQNGQYVDPSKYLPK